MLIVLFIVFIGLVLLGSWLYNFDYSYEGFATVAIAVGAFGAIASGAVIIGTLFQYPWAIKQRLEMYETENEKIEQKIRQTVETYMAFEKETYTELVKDAELETLLIVYPQLNSNELIKSEIEIYKENSLKIKELKDAQIYQSTYNWWLYFGN